VFFVNPAATQMIVMLSCFFFGCVAPMDYHHQMPLGQLTTIFPSPIPTAVEVLLFPLPMSNCQNRNCGFQTGSVELNEDLQVHNNLTPIQVCPI
jgi:hypothetical protein